MLRTKWLRALALLMTLSLLAAACGGDDDDDAADTGDDSTETTVADEGDGGGDGYAVDTGDCPDGVEDPIEGDGSGPIVYGAERIRDLGNHRTLYVGEDVRFRMIGGLYRVTIQAVGMDVSAVGRGSVVLDATGFTDLPGRFQINGGPFQPLPGKPTTFSLGNPPPPGQIGK